MNIYLNPKLKVKFGVLLLSKLCYTLKKIKQFNHNRKMINSSLSREKSLVQNLGDKIQIFSGKKNRLNRWYKNQIFPNILSFDSLIKKKTILRFINNFHNEIIFDLPISFFVCDKRQYSSTDQDQFFCGNPGKDRVTG